MFGFGKDKKAGLKKLNDLKNAAVASDGKLHKQVGERLGLDLHSADEGARIFAYEGIGRVLAAKVTEWPSQVLAAAAAKLSEPGVTDVVVHLSNRIPVKDIVAAASALQAQVAEIRVEYIPPVEARGDWTLRTECISKEDPPKMLSTKRPLDWSSLPDIVREAYMKSVSGAYNIRIYPPVSPEAGNG